MRHEKKKRGELEVVVQHAFICGTYVIFGALQRHSTVRSHRTPPVVRARPSSALMTIRLGMSFIDLILCCVR